MPTQRQRQDGIATKKNQNGGLTAEEWRARFGSALAATRRARNLSQQELGQQLGSAARDGAKVVQATVSSWEAGITVPTAEQIFALEKILGVDLCSFLGREVPGLDGKKKAPAPSIPALIAHDPNIPEVMRPVVLAMYLAACKKDE